MWVVRLRANLPNNQLNVTGVDHWAWRRNHRYGTIVYNLERRRALTLLPDCEIATVEAWIADHPEIKIVLSDRGPRRRLRGGDEGVASSQPGRRPLSPGRGNQCARFAWPWAPPRSMEIVRDALRTERARGSHNAGEWKTPAEALDELLP